MGFDLEWVVLPSHVLEARARALLADAAPDAWRKYREACFRTGCSFRANIWTMALLRAEMAGQGMLKDAELTFPDPVEYGSPDWDAGAQERFLAACDQVTGSDTGAGGIPTQKLSTNGFWLVTPAEIESALSVAGEYPRAQFAEEAAADEGGRAVVEAFKTAGVPVSIPELPDASELLQLWRRWLSFLAGASRHGGFVVS